ncbi:hypothetical protein GCM10009839_46600 [Catenulispora yoronensis]|uniref:Integrase n=1 Tax=Catenulispora yoronensis TaxID=450799 RepID=A0ABN2UN74_9ACTN
MYAAGKCLACYNFRQPAKGHHVGVCSGCEREQPLKTGYCRLCWHQARLLRDTDPDADARAKNVMAPWLPKIRHHQLFLADLENRVGPPKTGRRRGAKGRPLKPAPAPASRPIAEFIQPPLFDAGTRDYQVRRFDLRSATPDNPWLAWALYLAHNLAEARGWEPVVRRGVQRVLTAILAEHVAGDTVRASDVRPLFDKHSVSFVRVLEILAAMDVLIDDRPDTFDAWVGTKVAGLAPAIARDVTAWVNHRRHGGPRAKPRDVSTCRIQLSVLLPALTNWSSNYDHLREVTADDVAAVVDGLTGRRREMVVTALRSLFTWAKRTGLIFRNPAADIRLGRKTVPIWQPLTRGEIDQTVAAATTPQARLFVALAAIHGARPGQIRTLLLKDVDIPNRRITIAGRERPLDDLTHRVILHWLDHRRTRWPNTANPHLLINMDTALHHAAPSHTWILNLRGLPATIERLRIDRQLEEALANNGDPLLQAEVFGVHSSTAVRYATNAMHLLRDDPHATASETSPPTPGPIPDTGSGLSWSSA